VDDLLRAVAFAPSSRDCPDRANGFRTWRRCM